ncbi:hypothetical protein [Sedimenticola sp.]|uniref:hypothetical protein n=1 Tax=Sedimenticola sp. TaxID=1940285 RepID=UPI003D0E05B7
MNLSNIVSEIHPIASTREKSTPVTLDRGHLGQAKAAYNTRRVDLTRATHLLQGDIRPQAGDLVLARIEGIGQHTRIELANGRRALLYKGDEVIVCYGARYAPDQFESYLPDDLGPCHLVAAGGVASRCENRHKRMKPPTAIHPLGLLADSQGQRINMQGAALPRIPAVTGHPFTVAVVGTSMNAGKTTTVASLVRGFKATGRRIGTAKVSGTGAGGDRWAVVDVGADPVLDFTDAGVPSTFGLPLAQLEDIFIQLNRQLAAQGAEVVILEVADGLFQRETAALLASRVFREGVDCLLFAATDALGAKAGVDHLKQLGLEAAAVSGIITASPLASREAAQVLEIPVVSAAELANASWLPNPEAAVAGDELGRILSVSQALPASRVSA